MTIKAQSYAIGATETSFGEPGTRFYLLAASSPMVIKLYRDTQIVGEADGFTAGLELGPFCEPFTRWSATPQNGIAGSVLVGVGDDPMNYNPLGGALAFTNPAAGASAQPVGANSVPQTDISQGGNNYRVAGVQAAVAGKQSFVELSGGGALLAVRVTLNLIQLTNPGAAPITVTVGIFDSHYSAANAYTPSNVLGTGGASKVDVQSDASVGFSAFSTLSILTIAAGATAQVDLTQGPIVLSAGSFNELFCVCSQVDAALGFEFGWTEG